MLKTRLTILRKWPFDLLLFIIGRNQHEGDPVRNMAAISFAISTGILI